MAYATLEHVRAVGTHYGLTRKHRAYTATPSRGLHRWHYETQSSPQAPPDRIAISDNYGTRPAATTPPALWLTWDGDSIVTAAGRAAATQVFCCSSTLPSQQRLGVQAPQGKQVPVVCRIQGVCGLAQWLSLCADPCAFLPRTVHKRVCGITMCFASVGF